MSLPMVSSGGHAQRHLRDNICSSTLTQSLGWLVFDVDHEDSFEAWDRANLHPPNLYAQNPANGHSHLLYALATPVGTCDSHRRAPIELAAAVQRGMTRRLRADPCYANRLAKNPQHPRWRTSWLIGEPFDLKKLLEPLDREDTRPFAQRSEIAGISRNCDLFDALRGFAYANVLAFKETGNLNAWVRCLLEEARAINTCFLLPLSIGEMRQIARSVGKWTWHERFADIQATRASRGRSLLAKATSDSIATAIDQLEGRTTTVAIAQRIGKSPRTVRRYASQPRHQYEAHSLQQSRPWLAQGISRATWYRQKG